MERKFQLGKKRFDIPARTQPFNRRREFADCLRVFSVGEFCAFRQFLIRLLD
jgi:hypothetical protein